MKKHVDQFKPGQRIPYCHLNAEMANKSAPKLFHQVKLVGAKDPYNIITINLDPQRTLPGQNDTCMYIVFFHFLFLSKHGHYLVTWYMCTVKNMCGFHARKTSTGTCWSTSVRVPSICLGVSFLN